MLKVVAVKQCYEIDEVTTQENAYVFFGNWRMSDIAKIWMMKEERCV